MDHKTFMEKVAARAGVSEEEASTLTEALRDLIVDASAGMDSVAIPAFGNFEPRKRLERVSVHPSTGKRLLVPPKIVMGFKASAVLKSKLMKI